MRVICIDDLAKDGHRLQIKEGEIYTASDCPRKGYYIIHEYPKYDGCIVCYEKERFIPLSEIDETELINNKEEVTN